jgi:hypothetical protein
MSPSLVTAYLFFLLYRFIQYFNHIPDPVLLAWAGVVAPAPVLKNKNKNCSYVSELKLKKLV